MKRLGYDFQTRDANLWYWLTSLAPDTTVYNLKLVREQRNVYIRMGSIVSLTMQPLVKWSLSIVNEPHLYYALKISVT